MCSQRGPPSTQLLPSSIPLNTTQLVQEFTPSKHIFFEQFTLCIIEVSQLAAPANRWG
eukprot:c4563_g1_i2 orf=2-172(-)